MSELRVTIKSAAMELAAYIKAHNLRCGGPENEHDMQTCHDLSVAAEEVSSLQQQNTALQQQVKDLQAENSELERYYAKSIPPLATLLSLAVECDDSGDIGDKIRACVVKIKAALLSSKRGD